MKCLPLQMKRCLPATVNLIPQEWMINACHMHTNLMRSSGLQLTFDIRIVLIALQHTVMRDCALSIHNINRHLHTVCPASPDRLIDCPGVFRDHAMHNGIILSGNGMVCQLSGYMVMRQIVFAYN